MQVIEGHLDAQGLRFALVVSRFNEALTSRLESGAVDCLVTVRRRIRSPSCVCPEPGRSRWWLQSLPGTVDSTP